MGSSWKKTKAEGDVRPRSSQRPEDRSGLLFSTRRRKNRTEQTAESIPTVVEEIQQGYDTHWLKRDDNQRSGARNAYG